VLLLKTQSSKLHWKQGWQWQLLMCSPADHTIYEDFCSDFLKSAKQYKTQIECQLYKHPSTIETSENSLQQSLMFQPMLQQKVMTTYKQ
jgi:hypothetical protein